MGFCQFIIFDLNDFFSSLCYIIVVVRKFLVALLMLVMFTPSLACAMPICADEAQAAAVERPCAGHRNHSDSEKKSPVGKVNLLKDCMGVDLQVADDAASVKIPDLKKDIIFDDGLVAYSAKIRPAAVVIEIRGPPPGWPDPSRIQPSLILTTQRFRI